MPLRNPSDSLHNKGKEISRRDFGLATMTLGAIGALAACGRSEQKPGGNEAAEESVPTPEVTTQAPLDPAEYDTHKNEAYNVMTPEGKVDHAKIIGSLWSGVEREELIAKLTAPGEGESTQEAAEKATGFITTILEEVTSPERRRVLSFLTMNAEEEAVDGARTIARVICDEFMRGMERGPIALDFRAADRGELEYYPDALASRRWPSNAYYQIEALVTLGIEASVRSRQLTEDEVKVLDSGADLGFNITKDTYDGYTEWQGLKPEILSVSTKPGITNTKKVIESVLQFENNLEGTRLAAIANTEQDPSLGEGYPGAAAIVKQLVESAHKLHLVLVEVERSKNAPPEMLISSAVIKDPDEGFRGPAVYPDPNEEKYT